MWNVISRCEVPRLTLDDAPVWTRARRRGQRREAPVSFDLAVLAADPGADEAAVRAQRCHDYLDHVEGELDERIVAFHKQLLCGLSRPSAYDPEAPWMSMPLGTGIDHIYMNVKLVGGQRG
jgi:hypothetical protein